MNMYRTVTRSSDAPSLVTFTIWRGAVPSPRGALSLCGIAPVRGRVGYRLGRCLDVTTSESNEHVAEAVPLGTSDPPLRVSAFLRRPLCTATSLTVATVHDDGDARDVAHHRHEVTVGSRVVRRHDEEPPGRRKGS